MQPTVICSLPQSKELVGRCQSWDWGWKQSSSRFPGIAYCFIHAYYKLLWVQHFRKVTDTFNKNSPPSSSSSHVTMPECDKMVVLPLFLSPNQLQNQQRGTIPKSLSTNYIQIIPQTFLLSVCIPEFRRSRIRFWLSSIKHRQVNEKKEQCRGWRYGTRYHKRRE